MYYDQELNPGESRDASGVFEPRVLDRADRAAARGVAVYHISRVTARTLAAGLRSREARG
jgi:hypothetical protein